MKAVNIRILVTQQIEENYFAIVEDNDPILTKTPLTLDAGDVFQDSRFRLCDTDVRRIMQTDLDSIDVVEWTPADELEQRR
jgi:hypothetical protein